MSEESYAQDVRHCLIVRGLPEGKKTEGSDVDALRHRIAELMRERNQFISVIASLTGPGGEVRIDDRELAFNDGPQFHGIEIFKDAANRCTVIRKAK